MTTQAPETPSIGIKIAKTPNGTTIALPVTYLDQQSEGTQKVSAGVPNLSDALDAVKDFSMGFRNTFESMSTSKATVEFSMSFAVHAGKVTAMFVDGKAEGAIKVTLEWSG